MGVERRLLGAVALLSASVLANEVLLTRLLSLVHWHHYTSLVVGLALLGFAASGTVLALGAGRRLEPTADWFAGLALLYALAVPACFGAAQRVPFNALEVAWDPRQLAFLTAIYLILAVPFFFAGAAVGLLLVRRARAGATVYGADMVGAGIGSAGVLGVLLVLTPERALDLVGGLGALAAALAVGGAGTGRKLAAGAALACAAALAAGALGAWSAPRLSEFKGLAQALRAHGARVVATRSGPASTLHAVENRRAPLRSAPGLSIVSPAVPPPQIAIFRDGDAPTAVNRHEAGEPPPAYLDHLTSAAGYHLLEDPLDGARVAVLGAGGGSSVLQALAHGARMVDAVEADAGVVALLVGPLAAFAGDLYAHPAVTVHRREARGFLQRQPGAFDLISMATSDAPDASAAGAFALHTSRLLTVAGLAVALRALRPGAILSITTWNHLPPRTSLRVFATATAALRQAGYERPGASLAWLRGWSTATLLVKNGVLGAREIDALRRFTAARQFDVAWYPGMPAGEANRFNVLDRAYLYEAARALLGPGRERFLARYKLDVEPVPDTRPYPFSFSRWRHLPEMLRLRAVGGAGLLDVGLLVLLATLGAAMAAAVVLVAIPAWFAGARREDPVRVAGYFAGVGLGFVLIEIAVIQVLVQILHYRAHALSAVLGGFLLLAGAGSLLLERLRARRVLGPVLVAIVALALAAGVALPYVLAPLEQFGAASRALLVLIVIGPLAVLMGVPFPAAVTGLARAARAADVAWGWAANGCGSVIGAAGAALLAREGGYPVLLLAGAAAYAVAGLCRRAVVPAAGGRRSTRAGATR